MIDVIGDIDSGIVLMKVSEVTIVMFDIVTKVAILTKVIMVCKFTLETVMKIIVVVGEVNVKTIVIIFVTKVATIC